MVPCWIFIERSQGSIFLNYIFQLAFAENKVALWSVTDKSRLEIVANILRIFSVAIKLNIFTAALLLAVSEKNITWTQSCIKIVKYDRLKKKINFLACVLGP